MTAGGPHPEADVPRWYRPSYYLHFDRPIRRFASIRARVESPLRVAAHSFLPFIHFKKLARKYKRAEGRFVKKPRPISFASHLDALIFRRYALLLEEPYERVLSNGGVNDSVIAYRRFKPPKCNIHFAIAAIEFVCMQKTCTAIALDLKDFFESLDHSLLKVEWESLLGVDRLPPDHYAVFKAITRYSWVDQAELYETLGITAKREKDWRGPLCSPSEFRSLVRAAGLIKVKDEKIGIPQGSPISALLSNIYMYSVDREMTQLTKRLGGMYRRYSDDVLIVCPTGAAAEIAKQMFLEKAKERKLTVHDEPGKCCVSNFVPDGSGTLRSDKPLQYLGFTFDGVKARVRSHTLTRYFRRMKKATRRETFLARMRARSGDDPTIWRKKLYEKFSHLGKRNFISYAKRSHKLISRSAIDRQIRTHWRDLHFQLEVE